MNALAERNVTDIDENMVKAVVREANSMYVVVGKYERKYTNDSMPSVDIPGPDKMKATLTILPPGPGGADLSFEAVLGTLKDKQVTFGIKEDYIRDLLDHPVYKTPLVVAEGQHPVNGKDAYIQYNFAVGENELRLREGSNGRVDFKELNNIQNVVENQVLAKKIPREDGVQGRTVTGDYLTAHNGQDSDIPLGTNVHLGEDKLTVLSDISGQVLLVSGKVSVEPIYTIKGNVNLKTGNIIFRGSVIVTGNVEDGFSIRAEGNIEVKGTVEKAILEAGGDITVHKGITGKNEGLVTAGKSVYAGFIENAQINAGNMVIASDGIINSRVDAYKRIVCQGKRASIVGGHLMASEEINAKAIGSAASGTETICEVGIDPKKKEELDILLTNRIASERELGDTNKEIQTLIDIKQQRKSLPPDKEVYLRELQSKQSKLTQDIRKQKEDTERLQDFLNTLEARGRVSAAEKLWPGVKIIIRDTVEKIQVEQSAATCILDEGFIKFVKYEEPDEEATRGLDGNSAH
jgi:uncharacterized protein (DUF342 family)